MKLFANICAALSHAKAVAEQLPQTDRWKTFLGYVVQRITRLCLFGTRHISVR